MESPVMVLYILAAAAGLVSLEMRQAKASVAALGVAFLLFAIAMFVTGAVEVGVGVIIAGVVVVMVLRWGFARTVQSDGLPALPGGGASAVAIICVVLLAVALVIALRPYLGSTPASVAAVHGGQLGLVREALVVVAALAAVWAMLRKTGRRDE